MFDIGFFEILLILIVAILVIGPEELPNTARKLGIWAGRIRRSFFSIKEEVKREFNLDEMEKDSDQHDDTTVKKFEPSLKDSKRKL